MPEKHLRVEEISKVATIDLVSRTQKLFIHIYLPLVDSIVFYLYKMIPLVVPQRMHNNTSALSYVRPSHDYVSISEDQLQYFELN